MRSLRYCLFVTVSLTFANHALALDPLLVEFGWSQPNPVTLPANYGTAVDSHPWNGISDPAIVQYPTTTFAFPNAVAFWNQSCADGSACTVGFSNGGQQPFAFGGEASFDQILGGPNHLWADGWDGNPQPFLTPTSGWHAATYVPQIGGPNQALYGYTITAVEREITATTQTLRLYGVTAPVPEPSTGLLALFACAIHFSERFPRRNSSSHRSRY